MQPGSHLPDLSDALYSSFSAALLAWSGVDLTSWLLSVPSHAEHFISVSTSVGLGRFILQSSETMRLIAHAFQPSYCRLRAAFSSSVERHAIHPRR
jgi:hypothetical protein